MVEASEVLVGCGRFAIRGLIPVRPCGRSGAIRPAAPAGGLHQLAADDGFGHTLGADVDNSFHADGDHARPRPPALQLYFDAELVAGHHRAAEFSPLDPGEHDEFVLPFFHFRQQQCPARLGDGFHDQHARHDGQVGKVPGEEGFVDGHILDGHDPLLALDLDYAVDQQEGKPVWQDVENVDNVQRGLYRRRRCGRRVSGVGHFLSSGSVTRQERRLYCTASQPRNTARIQL